MSPEDLRVFDRVAGAVNRRYASAEAGSKTGGDASAPPNQIA